MTTAMEIKAAEQIEAAVRKVEASPESWAVADYASAWVAFGQVDDETAAAVRGFGGIQL